MKLRFTPRAVANLLEIGDYLHARNPAAARRVRATIFDSLQTLILFPHVGRKQKVEGVRNFVTHKHAYLVYYTVDEAAQEIVILNVKHPASRREHEDAQFALHARSLCDISTTRARRASSSTSALAASRFVWSRLASHSSSR